MLTLVCLHTTDVLDNSDSKDGDGSKLSKDSGNVKQNKKNSANKKNSKKQNNRKNNVRFNKGQGAITSQVQNQVRKTGKGRRWEFFKYNSPCSNLSVQLTPTQQFDAELTLKVYATMEKHKEVFFVVRLHSSQSAASLPPVNDPDPLANCELMDGRDAFLTLARDKHYEFSSLRRAKFSSMAMLYELHTGNNDRFSYTCNNCKRQMGETRYHCSVCDDFDLCVQCYQRDGHVHQMEKVDFPDAFGVGDDSALACKFFVLFTYLQAHSFFVCLSAFQAPTQLVARTWTPTANKVPHRVLRQMSLGASPFKGASTVFCTRASAAMPIVVASAA